MNLALLSDPHFTTATPIGRKDRVVEALEKKLIFIGNHLIKVGCYNLVVAGDLCDVKRSWDLLSILTRYFRWMVLDNGIRIFTVLGQHDSYYHEMSTESTVLGVLISSGLVERLGPVGTVSREGDKSVALYGASYGEPIPVPPFKPSARNILVVHKMIAMNRMWAGQKDLEYAPDFLKKHKLYELILCGDAHQRFIYKLGKRTIVNTGPVMRLDATEEMMEYEPKLFMYNTTVKAGRYITIPHEKGVLTREHINEFQQERADFDAFVEELTQKGRKEYSFEYILRRYLSALEKESQVTDRVKLLISEVMADETG